MTNYLDNVDSDWFSKRLSAALTVVIAAFVVLIARLLFLQVIEGGELRRLSEINSIRLRSVDAPRGLIYDIHDRLMADNRPSYDLSITVKDAHPLDQTIEKLSRYTGIDEAQFWESLEKAKGTRAYKPVLLKPDIGRDALAAIEVNRWDLPGILVNVSPRRDYIFSPSSAHLLGYMGEISVEELKSKIYSDCKSGDFIGKYGIERVREDWLRGKRGGQQVEVNATGQVVRALTLKRTVATADSSWVLTAHRCKNPARAVIFQPIPWGIWVLRGFPSGWIWKKRSVLSYSPTGCIPFAGIPGWVSSVPLSMTGSWNILKSNWIKAEFKKSSLEITGYFW